MSDKGPASRPLTGESSGILVDLWRPIEVGPPEDVSSGPPGDAGSGAGLLADDPRGGCAANPPESRRGRRKDEVRPDWPGGDGGEGDAFRRTPHPDHEHPEWGRGRGPVNREPIRQDGQHRPGERRPVRPAARICTGSTARPDVAGGHLLDASGTAQAGAVIGKQLLGALYRDVLQGVGAGTFRVVGPGSEIFTALSPGSGLPGSSSAASHAASVNILNQTTYTLKVHITLQGSIYPITRIISPG